MMKTISQEVLGSFKKLQNHTVYKNLYAKMKRRNPLLEGEMCKKSKYSPQEFLQPFLLASLDNTSIEDACEEYRNMEYRCPAEETVLALCRRQDEELVETKINHILEEEYRKLPGKSEGLSRGEEQ